MKQIAHNPWLAALAVCCSLLLAASWAAARDEQATGFRTATWDELIPKDWDPLKQFRERNLGAVREGSAQDLALMRELRATWDNAPVRAELDGARLRLPGFVVPLDPQGDRVREFLLVPYFGACIHSPPPPANQIIHVVLREPQALRTMATVWVSGTIEASRKASDMGTSGYAMRSSTVQPYAPDANGR